MDYEELMADVEEVQEEQMQRIQLEKTARQVFCKGFAGEEAMQTYEGIAMQFTRSKGYLTIQATEEGYSFIFMTLICMKSRVVITIIQTHPFRKLLMKS